MANVCVWPRCPPDRVRRQAGIAPPHPLPRGRNREAVRLHWAPQPEGEVCGRTQPFAETGEGFEHIAVPGYQPDTLLIGVQQRAEAVPLGLEEPVWMAESLRQTT